MNFYQKINKAWRVLATGISFSAFGIFGIIIPLIVVPILFLLPGNSDARERRGKYVVHLAFRTFIELMRVLGVLTYSVNDIAALNRPGQLILANHPSLVDVVFLIAFIRRTDCVIKSALLKNPFMRLMIGMANYIANDDPESVVAEAEASMTRGNSLIVFPEGTRTTPGMPIRMKRGAANIALGTGHDITPVTIHVNPTTLTKGLPWYQIPERRFHVSLDIQPNISIAPFAGVERTSLASRQLTRHLEDYFTKELGRDE